MSKTILITGATAGIGRHAALHFARAGHTVIATGRRADALRALKAEAGDNLHALVLDVTKPESIANAQGEVDRITKGYGLDALINNAGYGLVGPLEEITDADLRAQFETNVFGLMAMTRAFLPAMRQRGSGRIVNVSSMGGRVTFPFMGAYNATKYAVESLSDALRNEVAAFGVQVAVVEPGAIHTEFADRAMESADRYANPDSAYNAILERAGEIRQRMDSTAVGPEPVVRAIAHAVLARRASVRYVVPFRVRFFLGFFALLPTRVTDWLLQTIFAMKRLNEPRPAALGA